MIIQVKARRYYGGTMAGVETRPVWATAEGALSGNVIRGAGADDVTSWTYGPPLSPFGHLDIPFSMNYEYTTKDRDMIDQLIGLSI